MSGGRLHCQTPGCRRSTKPAKYTQWVCQKCYDRVPDTTRREHVEAKKALRLLARRRGTTQDDIYTAWNRAEAAWMAVKEAARGGLPDEDFLRHIGLRDIDGDDE